MCNYIDNVTICDNVYFVKRDAIFVVLVVRIFQ